MKLNKQNDRPGDNSTGKQLLTLNKLKQSVNTVILSLPDEVVNELTAFWRNNEFTNPENEIVHAPCFALSPGVYDLLREQGQPVNNPCSIGPVAISCSMKDFISQAPIEAIKSAITRELAVAYLYATGTWTSDAEALESKIRFWVTAWGHFAKMIIHMWLGVNSRRISNATELFFMPTLYSHFHRPPPATANLAGISAVLNEKGCSKLAVKVLAIPGALNLLPESARASKIEARAALFSGGDGLGVNHRTQ